jgi:anti-anti-sigma factor
LAGHVLRLEVVQSREGARTRLRLRGELDIASGELVAKPLAMLRERGESVVLDLDELTFIDASGIRLVLAAAEDARRDGWAFTVTHGSRQLRRVFVLLNLDKHLPYDSSTL